MFAVGGFFLGVGWAAREIYDRRSVKMKLRIVKNAKARFRDYSSIALATSALIVAFWLSLPDDWKPFLPAAWVAKGTGLLALWGFIGKFIEQDPPKAPK